MTLRCQDPTDRAEMPEVGQKWHRTSAHEKNGPACQPRKDGEVPYLCPGKKWCLYLTLHTKISARCTKDLHVKYYNLESLEESKDSIFEILAWRPKHDTNSKDVIECINTCDCLLKNLAKWFKVKVEWEIEGRIAI